MSTLTGLTLIKKHDIVWTYEFDLIKLMEKLTGKSPVTDCYCEPIDEDHIGYWQSGSIIMLVSSKNTLCLCTA